MFNNLFPQRFYKQDNILILAPHIKTPVEIPAVLHHFHFKPDSFSGYLRLEIFLSLSGNTQCFSWLSDAFNVSSRITNCSETLYLSIHRLQLSGTSNLSRPLARTS